MIAGLAKLNNAPSNHDRVSQKASKKRLLEEKDIEVHSIENGNGSQTF